MIRGSILLSVLRTCTNKILGLRFESPESQAFGKDSSSQRSLQRRQQVNSLPSLATSPCAKNVVFWHPRNQRFLRISFHSAGRVVSNPEPQVFPVSLPRVVLCEFPRRWADFPQLTTGSFLLPLPSVFLVQFFINFA